MKKLLTLSLSLISVLAFAQYPWNDQIIKPSTYNGTPAITTASGGSELVVDANGKVYYIGTDQLVHNYWKDANGDWQENALNTSAQPAIPNSGIVFDLFPVTPKLYYIGTDGYIHQCVPNNGTWPVYKLNSFVSGTYVPARNDSRLAIAFPGGNAKIYYVGTDNYLHYILWAGTGWATGQLSTTPSAVRAPSALMTDASGNVYYVRSDLQVCWAYQSGPNWIEAPLSATATAARPFTDLVMDELGRLYYVASDSRIHRFTYTTSWSEIIVHSTCPIVKGGTSFTYNNGQLIYNNNGGGNLTVIYNNGASFTQLTTQATSVLLRSFWDSKYGLSYYFDNLGKLHQVTPNLSVVNITTGNGKKHEKFEIGITLPTAVSSRINDFLDHVPNGNFTSPSTVLNPYDPDQVKVRAIFTAPNAQVFVRYGFYYRDVTAPVGTPNPYYWNIKYAANPFRLRIAPEQAGTWSVQLELYINNILTNSTSSAFQVDPSTRKGPLSLYQSSVGVRYLKDGDGYDFFAVGQNLDTYYTGAQYAYDATCCSGAVCSPTHAIYNDQRASITDLASKGANFIRIHYMPQDYEIEGPFLWNQRVYDQANNQLPDFGYRTLKKCLTNYDTRQHLAWEFDQTLDACEQNNMYCMLNIGNDAYFSHYGNMNLNTTWHYNPYSTYYWNPVTPAWDPFGQVSLPEVYSEEIGCPAYKSYSDISNTTQLKRSIYDFFSSGPGSSVFDNYKKRLFYIMARWGYSPNIAMWQIMNETDNAGATDATVGANSLYNQNYDPDPANPASPPFPTIIESWTTNVNTYLKSLYPAKLTINGYGGVHTAAPQNENLDIYSCNFYGIHFWDNLYDRFPKQQAFAEFKSLTPPPSSVHPPQKYGKGFLSGEQGFISEVETCLDIDAHNTVWSGIFTGQLGTPLCFWDQYQANGTDHRTKFGYIADFMSTVSLNFFDWKPNYNYSDAADPTKPSKIKRVETFYMTSNDAPDYTSAIGWFHNFSYNWYALQQAGAYNSSSCITPAPNAYPISSYPFPPGSAYTYIDIGLYEIQGGTFPTDPQFSKIYVDGLAPNESYYLELYDPYQGGYLWTRNQILWANAAGRVYLPVDLNNEIDYGMTYYPDYAFRLSRSCGCEKQANLSSPAKEEDNGISVFPNPSTGVINVSLESGTIASVEAYNTVGQLLLKAGSTGSKNIQALDLSAWKGSLIILKVMDNSGKVLIKKCMIN
jgi:hypothetical protein